MSGKGQGSHVYINKNVLHDIARNEVEIEHIKTNIIAIHEECVVYEDQAKDVKDYRDSEAFHQREGDNMQSHLDNKTRP